MLRYQPPKADIWGHRLRHMPAARARDLLHAFLDVAAGEHRFISASLTVLPESGDLARRFVTWLEVAPVRGGYFVLSYEQSQAALDKLVEFESHGDLNAKRVTLLQSFDISEWLIDASKVATRSSVGMHYGLLPCLSTLLAFDTEQQFEYVRAVLERLKICRLNARHLKELKPRRPRVLH
ncbi:MAG TPA: hypothetical protein VGI93_04670 [Steroidobacteraceae bacterium]